MCRWNAQAKTWHPPGTEYCADSCVVVEDLVHFCPWTGTTVAHGNIRWFWGFVGGVNFMCILLMVIVFVGINA